MNHQLLAAIITGGCAVLAALILATSQLMIDRQRRRTQQPVQPGATPPQQP